MSAPLRFLLRTATVLWATAALALAGAPPAADVSPRQLTAATIVSMLRLVTWRAAAGSTLTLTVVGDPTLADALRDASHGQRIDGRTLVVRQAASVTEVREPWPSVVVLAASQRPAASTAVRLLEPRGVLTIGEGEGMGQAGLVIGVYVAGDRIRFDANTGAAARAGLTLSSHLLRLSRIVG